MTSTPAISADGLRKQYGTLDALDGFDLQVETGTIHGLLGPNGAGKSTAVGVLATLLDADAGTATVAGFDVRAQGASVRRSIGLVGQAHAVDDILGGRQNLVMFGRLAGLGKSAALARASELLARFDLEDAADKPAAQYSGGMRRRLDIAIALILEPAVLFLDEPTTGLDPLARAGLWDVVDELTDAGTTVVLTTQYLEEADRLADHIVVLSRGRVAARGTPAELKRIVGGKVVSATVPAHQLAALPFVPDADRVDDNRVRASVTVDDAPAAIALVADLHDRGIEVTDLDVASPSLDDVFTHLAHTGAHK